MPFHMHINLEMVEAVYLTCATLLETPNIAAHPIASTRYVLSKPFLRLLETYKNQVRLRMCLASALKFYCAAVIRAWTPAMTTRCWGHEINCSRLPRC
jgi:hypothetical protein